MRITTAKVPGTARLARHPDLSRMARQRLKWMDYYWALGNNAAQRCLHFSISPDTFYRWRRRYNPWDLRSLKGKSHRPRRLRQPTRSRDLTLAVAALNQELLAWEHTYNSVRPHQALGYLTPHQFVTQWQHQRKEAKCHQSCRRVHSFDFSRSVGYHNLEGVSTS